VAAIGCGTSNTSGDGGGRRSPDAYVRPRDVASPARGPFSSNDQPGSLYNPPPAHSQEQPGENGASGSAASSSGGSNGEGSAGAGVSNGPVISGPTRDVVRETLSTSPA